MLKITNNQGYHMTFANGWTASVQFGYGNYCDNKDKDLGNFAKMVIGINAKAETSANAEVACWPAGGNLAELPDWLESSGDTVAGWLDADKVLKFLNWVAEQPR